MDSKLKTLLTLLFFFLLSFSSVAQTDSEPEFMVDDIGSQEVFLTNIFRNDREARYFEDSVMMAKGWHSPEHQEAIARLWQIDSVNLVKVDAYLSAHGYPDRANFSEEARIAPWQVLIHSSNSELRRENFHFLTGAYKDGDLEPRRFLLFLEDEYQRVFEKDFQSYSQGEVRIQELLKALEETGLNKTKLRFP